MDRLAHQVTVVLPAHNEESTIAGVIRGCVDAVPGLREVLVVDDGSTDRTADVARGAGARVARLDRNSGKGVAIRHALDVARGDVVVLLDADGQDDPAEIPILLDALTDDVDLVIGSRFLGRFERGAMSRVNRLGDRAVTGLMNALFRARITDTQAGFRAARRATLVAAGLQARAYDIETDMLLRVLLAGGRVVEVPVSRKPRNFGSSDLSRVRDGARILARMLRLRFAGR